MPSPAIVSLPAHLLGIELDAKLRGIARGHLEFLEYHRSEVFLARTERE
jgi:hypothetical protein